MKSSETQVATQKSVETAQKEAAKRVEKGKRKAEHSRQKERNTKKQKLTELLEAMKANLNLRQSLIDNNVERDTLLNSISGRDESMKQHKTSQLF